MQIEIRIDSSCGEPRVIVLTDRMSEEVSRIVRRLSDEEPELLTGMKDEMLEIIQPEDIIRIYSASGKVFAVLPNGEYTMRMRLYELEESLGGAGFVRISNSEIINLKNARSFDLSMAGTICVSLSDGTASYVSRRYVSDIKKKLGL